MIVRELTCEYLRNPIGVDAVVPRLSWQLEDDKRNQSQTAYRLLVASSQSALHRNEGDLWDTGRIVSDQSTLIEYAGRKLSSRQYCCWKVKTWSNTGTESEWGEAASWEMGLLQPDDWKAQWITAGNAAEPIVRPAPFFRKQLALAKPIKSARSYSCGLGYHELYINGSKIGDHVLDPAFTRFDRRVLYVTHDVTAMLRQGKNSVGVILGNGLFNQDLQCCWDFNKAPWRANPRVILQIHITYDDGSEETVLTGPDWKVTTGPIVFDATRSGEHYDARKELPGWSSTGYDDSAWTQAEPAQAPKGIMQSQMLPPIKVTRTLKPVAVNEVQPGVFVVDMGQNFTGWPRLKVSGPAGTEIVLKYAEKVDSKGGIDQSEIASCVKGREFQTDRYTLKGTGEETWEPRFTYHGFRWIEIRGFPGKPTIESIEGRVVHTSFEKRGTFRCSNELINKIQECTLWSYVTNFHGFPTDCPHREKNGWTGDAHCVVEAGLYNFNAENAYEKWMLDFKHEQRDTGAVPCIIPTGGWGYEWGSGLCWDSAYLVIPWAIYLYRGDKRVLEQNYEGMKRYVDFVTREKEDRFGLVNYGLGDWVPPFGDADDYTASVRYSASGFYYQDAVILANAAKVLGKPDDSEKYTKLAEKIKKAINHLYYDKISGLYAGGTQTAIGAALYQDFVEPSQRRKVARQLVAEIKQAKWRINAGLIGIKHIMLALNAMDRNDVAFRMATQTTFPSWGCWIEQGATTLWENWDGTSSRNHIMMGSISTWFYEALAGIRPAPDQPGFKHVVIRPSFIKDLDWVKAEHQTNHGPVRVSWQRGRGILTLSVSLPVNTTGTIHIPCSAPEKIEENGMTLTAVEGVRNIVAKKGAATFTAGSGTYIFEWPEE